MTPRRAMAASVLIAALLLLAAWCSVPEPRTLTETPTRLPMTVQPTVFVFFTPTPLVPEPVYTARDYVPSTRVPTRTATPTPEPTGTPTPRPLQAPVQRG